MHNWVENVVAELDISCGVVHVVVDDDDCCVVVQDSICATLKLVASFDDD